MISFKKQSLVAGVLAGGTALGIGVFVSAQLGGPSSSQTSYIVPLSAASPVRTSSILTTGDSVGSYRLAGIPDGTGAFDNGDGTFTLLVNHELGNTVGITRAHGGKGA